MLGARNLFRRVKDFAKEKNYDRGGLHEKTSWVIGNGVDVSAGGV